MKDNSLTKVFCLSIGRAHWLIGYQHCWRSGQVHWVMFLYLLQWCTRMELQLRRRNSRVSSTKSLVASSKSANRFYKPFASGQLCSSFETSLSAFKSANIAATGFLWIKNGEILKRRICCCKQFVSKWNGIICSCFLIFLFAWSPVEEVKKAESILRKYWQRMKWNYFWSEMFYLHVFLVLY